MLLAALHVMGIITRLFPLLRILYFPAILRPLLEGPVTGLDDEGAELATARRALDVGPGL